MTARPALPLSEQAHDGQSLPAAPGCIPPVEITQRVESEILGVGGASFLAAVFGIYFTPPHIIEAISPQKFEPLSLIENPPRYARD